MPTVRKGIANYYTDIDLLDKEIGTVMKTLKDMDCITIGDTGLNSALEAHELVKNKKDKSEVRTFFDDFVGWKSYLVIYLWRSLSAPKK